MPYIGLTTRLVIELTQGKYYQRKFITKGAICVD